MSHRTVFLNTGFVAAEAAQVSISDLAIQRGYGVFDYLRVAGNQPLFLDFHLQRFYQSADFMRLPVRYTQKELENIIGELMERNNLPFSGVRITLTGGPSADGYSIGEPNLIITQSPLHLPTAAAVEKGIRLITHPHQRQLPHIKTIDYLMAIWLQPLVLQSGAQDVLYQCNGVVSECPRANFFLVTQDNVLVTPAENILKGITRKNILEVAKQHVAVEERDVTLQDIAAAKEAFISSTTKAILPVTGIDDVVLHGGTVGTITRRLYRLLFDAGT